MTERTTRYVECRVNAYKTLFSPPFDEDKWNALQDEAEAIWPTLSEEERNAAALGYFAGVQKHNRETPK